MSASPRGRHAQGRGMRPNSSLYNRNKKNVLALFHGLGLLTTSIIKCLKSHPNAPDDAIKMGVNGFRARVRERPKKERGLVSKINHPYTGLASLCTLPARPAGGFLGCKNAFPSHFFASGDTRNTPLTARSKGDENFGRAFFFAQRRNGGSVASSSNLNAAFE